MLEDFDLSCSSLCDMAIYPVDAEVFQYTATPAQPAIWPEDVS